MNASTACTGVALQAYSVPLAGAATTSTSDRLDPDHHGADDDPDDNPDHLAPTHPPRRPPRPRPRRADTTSARGIHRRQRHDAGRPPPRRARARAPRPSRRSRPPRRHAGRPDAAEGPELGRTTASAASRRRTTPCQGQPGDRPAAIVTAQGQVRDAQLTAEADLHPQTPAQIAQARSDVDSAQVQVDTATRALDGTVLKAPIAGVVLAVNGKVGESSGSASSSTSSTTAPGDQHDRHVERARRRRRRSAGSGFITIANPSRLEVTANIAEADAAGLQLGQQATITVPGHERHRDRDRHADHPAEHGDQQRRALPDHRRAGHGAGRVKTGSTASLAITDGQATGVLEVPTAAITTVGTNHTVTVRRERHRHRRPGRRRPRPARRPPRSRAASPRATCSCCPRPPRARRRATRPVAGSRGWAAAGESRVPPGHRAAVGVQDLRCR